MSSGALRGPHRGTCSPSALELGRRKRRRRAAHSSEFPSRDRIPAFIFGYLGVQFVLRYHFLHGALFHLATILLMRPNSSEHTHSFLAMGKHYNNLLVSSKIATTPSGRRRTQLRRIAPTGRLLRRSGHILGEGSFSERCAIWPCVALCVR